MSSAGLTGEAAERNRQRAREWREKNPERAAATKRDYVQRNAEAVAARKRAWYEENRERLTAKQRAYGNARRAELRAEIIETYGGRCACPGCHVEHAELLTIDHVNGGASHRQNRRSTRDIYAQIKAAGFPDDYQLLCGSCNLAKSSGPACPLEGIEH